MTCAPVYDSLLLFFENFYKNIAYRLRLNSILFRYLFIYSMLLANECTCMLGLQ
jgi:hypothetical protein